MSREFEKHFRIGRRDIGPGHPTFIIAELSANHHQSLQRALELVDSAGEAGADAIKLQTYTADTMTLDCESDPFRIKSGSIWDGQQLHALYQKAYTPWEWHEEIFARAAKLGMEAFSSPFDSTAVAFLEGLNVPAYKIASFELVDLPLIEVVAKTGRPMILSTGMATIGEIGEAVEAASAAGCRELALLKCNSAYPAPAGRMNLSTIGDLSRRFDVPVGLSDHTLENTIPPVAVALGASIIEKHFCISRDEPGPDSAFSLEPDEFREMVRSVRLAEAALGEVAYGPTDEERSSLAFRRSLFVIEDVEAGGILNESNVRAIRPADGLPPKELGHVLGRRVRSAIPRGTPLSWELIEPEP